MLEIFELEIISVRMVRKNLLKEETSELHATKEQALQKEKPSAKALNWE